MTPRGIHFGLALLLTGAIGCGGGESPAGDESTGAVFDDVLRTGDPYARGYTDEDFPRVQEIADGVFTYEQLRSAGDEKFTTVSLFVVTGEGVLVADGQGSPEETARLVEAIEERASVPITHVVICSDHGDHTAGNVAFPDDAVVIAHPTSRDALEAAANRPGRADDAPPVVMPTVLVEERLDMILGGREIQILFLGRAHTGGDLVVYLPAEKILFMSEAFLNHLFPAMRSAYPSEWVEMIERAQEMDVETYVPGHGFVDSPEVLQEELERFRLAILEVIQEAKRLHAVGMAPEAAAASADFGELETWTLYESQAQRAIEKVYEEIEGRLP